METLNTETKSGSQTGNLSQDFEGLPGFKQINFNDGFNKITPLCLRLMGDIEHRVIRTKSEYDAFKGRLSDMSDYLDELLEELIEFGIVSFEGENFVFHSDKQWLYGDNESYRESAPGLAKLITERAVSARRDGTADRRLDFADYHNFPDEPGIAARAEEIINGAREALRELATLKPENESNASFRAVVFSGAKFDNNGGF